MKSPAWLLLTLICVSPAAAVDVLPGTQPLTWDGDISLKMVDDLHTFADRLTTESIQRRDRHWHRDFSSRKAYEESIAPNRERLAKYLGIHRDSDGNRWAAIRDLGTRTWVGRAESYQVYRVNVAVWSGFVGQALELIPTKDRENEWGDPGLATVIVIPDAVAGPEDVVEFQDLSQLDLSQAMTMARRLAENGVRVVIPRLISRSDEYSVVGPGSKLWGNLPAAGVRATNQPHREFIYRQAFEMGRSMIGYDVELLRALIATYARQKADGNHHSTYPGIVLFGHGEGGLLALYTAALDKTVGVTIVSGYFDAREKLADEPIYRNVWGLLDEFGDAELATLIAPRKLIIEPCRATTVAGPPPERDGRRGAAPGVIATPQLDSVRSEMARARRLLAEWKLALGWITMLDSVDATQPPGSESALRAILAECRVRTDLQPLGEPPNLGRSGGSSGAPITALYRERFPFQQLVDHTQALMHESEYVRKEFWKNADRASRDPEKWKASLKPYRDHLYDEVLGRFDLPKLPPDARTRKIYDEPKYAGYEVVLDVFGADAEQVDVWTYGILLVPKDIKFGERRPVVVCQHGLEGRPQMLCEPGSDHYAYHRYAGQLAERGFVVFAPQNPYIGKDHFRQLVRKLYPLKKTLWSVIVPQHEQITDWLASLPFVDPERIGFYGLSYGGKTAMRVPALVERYCLSICSGDFNEWIRKCTSVRDTFSYMGTHEYEMYEFDLGHTFNYAELAYLIAPRPFMVERGHRDGVGIDEWVSYEYAKVRMLYADLKIPERTEIEYFDGPHTIRGVGTFAFLHKHLNWPQ